MRFIDLYEAENTNQTANEPLFEPVDGHDFWSILDNAIKKDDRKLSSLLCRFSHKGTKVSIKRSVDDEDAKIIDLKNSSDFNKFKDIINKKYTDIKNSDDPLNNAINKLNKANAREKGEWLKTTLYPLLSGDAQIDALKEDGTIDRNSNNNFKTYNTWEEALAKDDFITFVSRIKKSKENGKFFINGIQNPQQKDVKNIKIAFKNTDRKQSSDAFRKFRSAFIKRFNNWENNINTYEAELDRKLDSGTSSWLFNTFFGLIKDDAQELTKDGTIRDTKELRAAKNNVYGKPNDYRKLGQALVFFSAKFLSRAANEDTDISNVKDFNYIMQGVFGEAGGNTENDSFLQGDANLLMKIGGIKAKMQIDAAKAVIAAKSNNAHNDQGYYGSKGSMYDSVEPVSFADYLNEVRTVIKVISEASTDADQVNMKTGAPLSVGDFDTKNPENALHQAWAVRSAHPKEFDIEYDKLKAAFDEGLKDYQDKFRAGGEFAKTGKAKNPITDKMEDIKHSGFGTGGPMGFIKKHERLNNLVNDIDTRLEWNIFTTGPKLLIKLFKAIEAGGDMLQKFCDDIASNWKGFKDLMAKLDPKAIQRETDKFIKDKEGVSAVENIIAKSLIARTGIYSYLTNPQIRVYTTQHAIATMDNKFNNIEEPYIKEMAAKYIDIIDNNLDKVVEYYKGWKEMADKRNESIKAKQKKNKDQKQGDKGEQQNPPAENASYKPKYSFINFLNEEDANAQGNNQQQGDAKQTDAKGNDPKAAPQEEEKEIPVILNLDATLAAIMSEYNKVCSDTKTKAANIEKALEYLADYDEEKADRYENDDFSGNSEGQFNTNLAGSEEGDDAEEGDNKANQNASFEYTPIDLSKYLTEMTGEEDDDSSESSSSEPKGAANANTGDNQAKEPQEKSNIEKVIKNANKDNILALANAMKELANADELSYNDLSKIITDAKKPDTVLKAIEEYQKSAKAFKDALNACTKIVTLDNELANIDQTTAGEGDAVGLLKNANFDLLGVNVETQKKEDKEENSAQNVAIEDLEKYGSGLAKAVEDTFKNVISTIHNACKVLEDDANPTSDPSKSTQNAEKFASLHNTVNGNLKPIIETTGKAIIAFCEKYDKDSADIFKQQFQYVTSSDLTTAPRIVYFLNLVNLAKAKLPSAIKNAKSNTADQDLIGKLDELSKKLNVSTNKQTNIDVNTLTAGYASLNDKYDVDIMDNPEKIDTKKIHATLGTLISLSKKAILGFVGLLPNNPDDGIYWKIASNDDPSAGQKELQAEYKKLQDSVGNTYMGIKNDRSSSFIFGIRHLTDFLNTDAAKEHPELTKFIKDCQPDIEKLQGLKTGRDIWDLIEYLSIADAIFKRLGQAKLKDEEYTIIYKGAKAGEKVDSDDTTAHGEGAQGEKTGITDKAANAAGTAETSGAKPANNASYIPDYSPDMLINEIYKYIRGN